MTLLGPDRLSARLDAGGADPGRHDTTSDGAPRGALAALLREAGLTADRCVGRGAGSEVWAATTGDGELVAVKAVPATRGEPAAAGGSGAGDRLAHEAQVLAHLATHPRLDAGARGSIVQLRSVLRSALRPHGTDLAIARTDGEVVALVLAPLGGVTLDEWWSRHHGARHGTAPRKDTDPNRIADLLALLGQLLPALAAVHAAGVTHGDISPRNIVRCGRRWVLVDFEAATLHGDGAGGARGTLPYTAPEIVRGDPPRPSSDRYALARVVVELVRGRTKAAAVSRPAPDELERHGCPAPLAAVVAAAVAPDPHDRPTHAAWVAAHQAAATGAAVTRAAVTGSAVPGAAATVPPVITVEFGPRPPRPDPPVGARPSRHPTLPALVIGCAAVALLVATLGVRSSATRDATDGSTATSAPTDRTSTPTTGTNHGTDTRADAGTEAPEPPAPQVRWDAQRAEATVTTGTRSVRYRLGAPGDQLVVGRWDCRGESRPVLYRPSAGDLYEFPGWADPHGPAPTPQVSSGHPVDGRVRTVIGADHCLHAVVDNPVVDNPVVDNPVVDNPVVDTPVDRAPADGATTARRGARRARPLATRRQPSAARASVAGSSTPTS